MSNRPLIISFCGRGGSGKTTAQNFLIKHIQSTHAITFASPIKVLAKEIYQLSNEQLYGTQEQKETIDPSWNKAPRQLMQDLGKILRDVMGEDIWVSKAVRDIKELFLIHKNSGDHIPVYVIDDSRYINEAYYIKEDKSIESLLIKLECPDAPKSKFSEHASEAEVDQIPIKLFDKIIVANRSENAILLKRELANYLMSIEKSYRFEFTSSSFHF